MPTSSVFAAASTGGACRRRSKASPRTPAKPDLRARGMTRIVMMMPSGVGSIIGVATAPWPSFELPPTRLAMELAQHEPCSDKLVVKDAAGDFKEIADSG